MNRTAMAMVAACLLSTLGGQATACAQTQNSDPAAEPQARPERPQRVPAQATGVPRLIKFSGKLTPANDGKNSTARAGTGPVGVTFAIYQEAEGGAPLWLETQNVQADEQGRFAVLLGSGKPEGIPAELFAANEARWLGVQAAGQPEQPRVLLVSVPYALKAADAETLGGQPASAFLLAKPEFPLGRPSRGGTAGQNAAIHGFGTLNTVPIFTAPHHIGDSVITQSGGNIAVGTAGLPASLAVSGNLNTAGNVTGKLFSGSGVGLTNVNAASLGGLSLSSFPQLNASNIFVGDQEIVGRLAITSATVGGQPGGTTAKPQTLGSYGSGVKETPSFLHPGVYVLEVPAPGNRLDFVPGTTGTPVMSLFQDGRVGIGTINPLATLGIFGDINLEKPGSGIVFPVQVQNPATNTLDTHSFSLLAEPGAPGESVTLTINTSTNGAIPNTVASINDKGVVTAKAVAQTFPNSGVTPAKKGDLVKLTPAGTVTPAGPSDTGLVGAVVGDPSASGIVQVATTGEADMNALLDTPTNVGDFVVNGPQGFVRSIGPDPAKANGKTIVGIIKRIVGCGPLPGGCTSAAQVVVELSGLALPSSAAANVNGTPPISIASPSPGTFNFSLLPLDQTNFSSSTIFPATFVKGTALTLNGTNTGNPLLNGIFTATGGNFGTITDKSLQSGNALFTSNDSSAALTVENPIGPDILDVKINGKSKAKYRRVLLQHGRLELEPDDQATTAAAFGSTDIQQTASVFNSATQSAEDHSVIFQTVPTEGTNNTDTPSVTLIVTQTTEGGTATPVFTAGKDALVAKSFGVQLPIDPNNPPVVNQPAVFDAAGLRPPAAGDGPVPDGWVLGMDTGRHTATVGVGGKVRLGVTGTSGVAHLGDPVFYNPNNIPRVRFGGLAGPGDTEVGKVVALPFEPAGATSSSVLADVELTQAVVAASGVGFPPTIIGLAGVNATTDPTTHNVTLTADTNYLATKFAALGPTGTIAAAQVPPAFVHVGIDGNITVSNSAITAASFIGNGSALTALNPANLSPGTANINISGNAATAMSAGSAASFTGQLAGDVAGTQSATHLVAINGAPVASTVPAGGAALVFDGTQWAPGNLPSAALTGSYTNPLTLSNTANAFTGALNATGGVNLPKQAANPRSSALWSFHAEDSAALDRELAWLEVAADPASPAQLQLLASTGGTPLVATGLALVADGSVTATRFIGNGASLTNLDLTNPNTFTGILALQRGGTGISAAPTASGQFLRSSAAGSWAVAALQASDVPDVSGTYLTIGGNQTVSGTETFNNISVTGTLMSSGNLNVSVPAGAVIFNSGSIMANSKVTVNPGATPTTALALDVAPLTAAGMRNSHALQLTGRAFDTAAHVATWQESVDVTSNAGASLWCWGSGMDSGPIANRGCLSDTGVLTAAKFSGDGSMLTGVTASGGVVSVTATSPLVSSGGANPNISLSQTALVASLNNNYLQLNPAGTSQTVHGLVFTDSMIVNNVLDAFAANFTSASAATIDTGQILAHGGSATAPTVGGSNSAVGGTAGGFIETNIGGKAIDANATGANGIGANISASGVGGTGVVVNVSNGANGLVVQNSGTGDAIQVLKSGVLVAKIDANGTVTKAGGNFKIDHPLDPANKSLSHSFVESPDMMNIYNGVVLLDARGEAWVTMPDWFEALNRDFRYQLTAIGAPGPNLYIAEEISGNRFKIAGGRSGLKVSWQVTGIRHDAWANAHRIQVEEQKPAPERGTYMAPELFGGPAEGKAAKSPVPAAAATVSNLR